MVTRTTRILLGVFVVLLLVAILISRQSGEEPADLSFTPAPSLALFEFGVEAIQRFEARNLDGQVIAFERTGTGWQSFEPAASEAETDSVRISNLLSQLVTVRVVNSQPIEAPFSVIGLEFAPHQFTVVLSDGRTFVVRIGEKSATSTGYYVQVNGEAPVLITKATVDLVIGLFAAPPLLPTPTFIPTQTITATVPISATLPISGSATTVSPAQTETQQP